MMHPMLSYEALNLRDDLSYEEEPVTILERSEREFGRHRRVIMVKVLWKNHSVEEATWEREAEMQSRYPHLFGMI